MRNAMRLDKFTSEPTALKFEGFPWLVGNNGDLTWEAKPWHNHGKGGKGMEFLKAVLFQLATAAVCMAAALMLFAAPIIWRDWGWLLMIPGLFVGVIAVFMLRELNS